MKLNKYIITGVVLIVIAIASILAGLFQDSCQAVFVWRSLLLNTMFFAIISLFGTLFFSFHKLANASWIQTIQPVLLTMGKVFIFILILYVILTIGLAQNFSWVTESSNKEWYLNWPFFIIRNIIILGGFAFFTLFLSRKYSSTNKILPAFFVMFTGIAILFFSYDWIVALDPQWFSTLFGWYLFAGLLVSGLAFLIIFIRIFGKQLNITLEDKVYQYLARYLFAFTMFWAYLWYVQYMLVWFVNKPVESHFFVSKIDQFPILFYGGLITGFAIPFVLLLSNYARNNKTIILIAAISGFIGQWCDKAFYIFPEPTDGKFPLLLISIGMFVIIVVFFIGLLKYEYKKRYESL